jgi:ankyrin repeat and BTB/POZ domain-containing protein 1
LRFEDSGLEDIMDENGEIDAEAAQAISEKAPTAADDEAIDMESPQPHKFESDKIPSVISLSVPADIDSKSNLNNPSFLPAGVRTLDGEIAGDEFAADAINYQVLLGKIDNLLDRLNLDA